MEISVEPSKTYAVTTSGSCTVTDADGLELCTASSGSQAFFVATTPTVTISDDGAKVSRATFNYALAALGLLGGGDKLPAGYTRVDFILRDDSLGTGYLLNETFTGRVGVQLTAFKYKNWGGQHQRLGVHQSCYLEMPSSTSFTVGVSSAKLLELPTEADTRLVWSAFFRGSDEVVLTTEESKVSGNSTYKFTPTSLALFGCKYGSNVGYVGRGRIYELRVSEDSNEKYIFKPCVSQDGTILLCCTKTGKLFEPLVTSNAKPNRAGLTAAQAVTLCRNLSSDGGSLRLVLPEGYDINERVVNALTEAESKGWVLTIQTYAEQTAAATFALRRVWVRKVQDENGSYVAADGSRWQVEWCVDVIGADPESLGYERYRSVNAAVAYWELVPYEHTEEELSTAE